MLAAIVTVGVSCTQSMFFGIPSTKIKLESWIDCPDPEAQEPAPEAMKAKTKYTYVNALRHAFFNDSALITETSVAHQFDQGRAWQGILNVPLNLVTENTSLEPNGFPRADGRYSFDGWFEVADTVAAHYLGKKTSFDDLVKRFVGGCDQVTSNTQAISCLTDFVEGFGKHLFGRDLTSEELLPFWEAFPNKVDLNFHQGGVNAIRAFLLHPEFLFHLQQGRSIGGDLIELSDVDIAKKIAYSLTSSEPDTKLWTDARAGRLRDRSVRRFHVRRLLKHECYKNPTCAYGWYGNNLPAHHTLHEFIKTYNKFGKFSGYRRGHPFMEDFARSQYVGETANHHDHEKAMKLETMDLFTRHMLTGDGNFHELWTDEYAGSSDYDLMRLYGAPYELRCCNSRSEKYRYFYPVSLPGQRGGYVHLKPAHRGLLVRALRTTGGWVYPNLNRRGMETADLLCKDIPEPDPTMLPPNFRDSKPRWQTPDWSTRHATAAQTGAPMCYQCHKHSNPYANATANIDGIGRDTRTYYTHSQYPTIPNKERIYAFDRHGEAQVINLVDINTRSLVDLDEKKVLARDGVHLSSLIGRSKEGLICFTRKYFEHAMRRKATLQDSCTLRSMYDAVRNPAPGRKGSLREMMVELYAHPQFIKRKFHP